MAKLQESKGRYSITLPTNIVRLLQWKKGDDLILESDLKGRLYLKKE